MLRKIIVADKNQYMLQIPDEYLHRKIEILVLPFDSEIREIKKRYIEPATFKCGGKIRDFIREDAYRENLC